MKQGEGEPVAIKSPLSRRLWINWLIDAVLGVAAAIASLSGIYFLFLPMEGLQGGRNPYYGVHVLFERHTWEELHLWGGLAMVGIAIIHLAVHWRWVLRMARRMAKAATGSGPVMSRAAWINLWLDLIVGSSFILTSVSGIVFLLPPDGAIATVADRVLSPMVWDLLHTWAGIVLIAASALHIDVHRGWILKTTLRAVQSLGLGLSSPTAQEPIAPRP
jgi:hypothetical protein